MRPQQLKHPVTIAGHGLLGFETELTLSPTTSPGWSISFPGADRHAWPLAINASAMRLGFNGMNVNLEYPESQTGKRRAHIVEHLLALREGLGLYDGVCVTVGKYGIPFTGHAAHFVDAVSGALEDAENPLRCYTTGGTIGGIETPDGGGYVEFHGSSSGNLILEISIDYPGIGARRFIWDSTRDTLADIAGTRGELKSMYRRIIDTIDAFGWPHKEAFADIQKMDSGEWLESLVRHRAIDALGELALVAPQGKLSGTYRCHRAGHREAVRLVRAMTQSLVGVRELSQVA